MRRRWRQVRKERNETELELKNGEYVRSEDGGLATVSGTAETVQRIMMRLCARRGGFYPMPDFGSRLYKLIGMRSRERDAAARQFIHEALADEDAEIKSIECRDGGDSLFIDLRLDISGTETELGIRI